MWSVLRNTDFILSLMGLTLGFNRLAEWAKAWSLKPGCPGQTLALSHLAFGSFRENILPFCVSVSSSVECG